MRRMSSLHLIDWTAKVVQMRRPGKEFLLFCQSTSSLFDDPLDDVSLYSSSKHHNTISVAPIWHRTRILGAEKEERKKRSVYNIEMMSSHQSLYNLASLADRQTRGEKVESGIFVWSARYSASEKRGTHRAGNRETRDARHQETCSRLDPPSSRDLCT